MVDAALRVHKEPGPGLLEGAYEACLVHELRKRRLRVASQVALPLVYDGLQIESGYRIDLLVEDSIIVEVKAVETLGRIHEARLISYVKLSQKKIGLLINFNVVYLKEGIKRFAN